MILPKFHGIFCLSSIVQSVRESDVKMCSIQQSRGNQLGGKIITNSDDPGSQTEFSQIFFQYFIMSLIISSCLFLYNPGICLLPIVVVVFEERKNIHYWAETDLFVFRINIIYFYDRSISVFPTY